MGGVLQLVQLKLVVCVHGWVFKRVGWECWALGQLFGHIASSFSGCAKTGGAEFPSHLKAAGHDHLDGLIGVGLGENTAEIEFLSFGHNQAPETVLDVQLHEDPWAFVLGAGCKGMDKAWEHLSKLGHGVKGWWFLRVGGIIHGGPGGAVDGEHE